MTAITLRLRTLALVAVLGLLGHAAAAWAQAPLRPKPTGRISFYAHLFTITPDQGPARRSGDFVTNASYQVPDAEGDGMELGFDVRHSDYTDRLRPTRVSDYDGYVGARFGHGHVRVRAGQMWLNDLGGLGSLAGGVVEYKASPTTSGPGRLRIGVFGGVEPTAYEFGYVPGIRKVGGYLTLEGSAGRRHTAGYIRLDHSGLVERSVVTTTNFLPFRSRLFVYQSAEYDLVGPAGQGHGQLSYFFLNANGSPTSRLDLQGLYHRGRSIDTRSITDDVLAGRPLREGALDGLLYASAGGRITVRVTSDLRLNAGYSRDRNNRDSTPTTRMTGGASAGDIAGSGVDATVSFSRFGRPSGQYDSLYVSIGRQLGRRVYISGDYSSSVSVLTFTGSDGIAIETRPETHQLSASGVVTFSRHVSCSWTVDRTRDDASTDFRVLSGMTYRFR
jgi:hypothetical protein